MSFIHLTEERGQELLSDTIKLIITNKLYLDPVYIQYTCISSMGNRMAFFKYH